MFLYVSCFITLFFLSPKQDLILFVNSLVMPFLFFSSCRQDLFWESVQPRGHAGNHQTFTCLSRWSAGTAWRSQNSPNCVRKLSSLLCLFCYSSLTLIIIIIIFNAVIIPLFNISLTVIIDNYFDPPGIPTLPWTSCLRHCPLSSNTLGKTDMKLFRSLKS